jgi:hypothetical protein
MSSNEGFFELQAEDSETIQALPRIPPLRGIKQGRKGLYLKVP